MWKNLAIFKNLLAEISHFTCLAKQNLSGCYMWVMGYFHKHTDFRVYI